MYIFWYYRMSYALTTMNDTHQSQQTEHVNSECDSDTYYIYVCQIAQPKTRSSILAFLGNEWGISIIRIR